jgi:hypothetical protein
VDSHILKNSLITVLGSLSSATFRVAKARLSKILYMKATGAGISILSPMKKKR